jgi:hypothetical protein
MGRSQVWDVQNQRSPIGLETRRADGQRVFTVVI